MPHFLRFITWQLIFRTKRVCFTTRIFVLQLSHPKMLQLITRRRSVTNAPPALSAFIAPGVSAPLNREPTPFTEATPTASQVPVSSTSSVSVQSLSARQPHWCRREPEPSNHTSSASRIEGGASQPGSFF
ncbi:hypothetical protein DVH24_034051 [Malus domestica]|uniref:Uncharacterized protein n=1 Tax=Malus domestica TaxID=3750 RepID=A0A498KSL0_MALDO|nr:hypothetical protein DVH24_034051 [Malus domestica]